MIVSSGSKYYKTGAVRVFMEHMAEMWPGSTSRAWFRTFLSTVKLFRLKVGFEEWQISSFFTGYLGMLYSIVPEYFTHAMFDDLLEEAQSGTGSPFSNLKGTILEVARILPALRTKPLPSSPYEPEFGSPLGQYELIKKLGQRFRVIQSSLFAKESLKTLIMAVDFWLQMTGFCEELVIRNEHPEKVNGLSKVGKMAIMLGKELHNCFKHVIYTQQDVYYEPSMILEMLAKLHMSRVAVLMAWCGHTELPHKVAAVIGLVEKDYYTMANAVWAMRLWHPKKLHDFMIEREFVMTTSAGDPAEVFMRLYTSAGAAFGNPCRIVASNESVTLPRIIRWAAPLSLARGELDSDTSLALIRSYLLLKFGIPFETTRSNLSIIAQDTISPDEYGYFMNFWMERYCALHCPCADKKHPVRASNKCVPRFKIVVEGLRANSSDL